MQVQEGAVEAGKVARPWQLARQARCARYGGRCPRPLRPVEGPTGGLTGTGRARAVASNASRLVDR